jgi:hypothetical protein
LPPATARPFWNSLGPCPACTQLRNKQKKFTNCYNVQWCWRPGFIGDIDGGGGGKNRKFISPGGGGVQVQLTSRYCDQVSIVSTYAHGPPLASELGWLGLCQLVHAIDTQHPEKNRHFLCYLDPA